MGITQRRKERGKRRFRKATHRKKHRGGLNTPPPQPLLPQDKGYMSIGPGTEEENYVLGNTPPAERESAVKRVAEKNTPKSPLRKSSKEGIKVDYKELMESYLASQKTTIGDLNARITKNRDKVDLKNPNQSKHYYELLETLHQLFLINKDYGIDYINKLPPNEEKALKNLREIFRDQINFMNLKNLVEKEIMELNELIKKNKNYNKTSKNPIARQITEFRRKQTKRGINYETFRDAETAYYEKIKKTN
jgi:hypothetical protein